MKFNYDEEYYQYNDGKFYLDLTNRELTSESLEKHRSVAKLMKEAGKTEEEIREELAGK